MPLIDNKYQENGFVLLLYKDRHPDPNMTCPDCGRKTYHVATIYDEWSEAHASFTYYHYCKRDETIIQRVARTDDMRQIRTTTFQQPPFELLIELLATSRQQNGRNVTELTINRHWWAPRRYPLHLGAALVVINEAVSDPVTILGEGIAVEIPIARYEPPASPPRNPFTSRPTSGSTDGIPSADVAEENPSTQSASDQVEDDKASPTQP